MPGPEGALSPDYFYTAKTADDTPTSYVSVPAPMPPTDPKPCPLCEGRRVTGRILRGEDGRTLRLAGRDVPVVVVADRPCGECGGSGAVGAGRYAALTGGRR